MGRSLITIDKAAIYHARKTYNMGWNDICEKFGVSHPTARREYRKAELEFEKNGIPAVPNVLKTSAETASSGAATAAAPAPVKDKSVTTNPWQVSLDEAFKKYEEWIGWTKEVKPAESRPSKSNGEKKILAINDLHVPYHDDECLEYIIKVEAADTDVLVIAGDLADMFNFSRYMKFSKHFTAEEEFRAVQGVLNLLAASFPKVIIMRGNHDDRYIKWLARCGMNPEVMQALEFLYGDQALHPINVFASKLPNVEIAEVPKCGYAEYPHLFQYGDIIFSHAEKFSKIPNQAVGKVIQWLQSEGLRKGIIKPFSVVAQAHTHQAGKTYNDFGVWGYEMGCLAKDPDYAGSPSMHGAGRPSVLGYTVFYQSEEGITDIARSHFLPLRW